jgi:hypothetical protein
MATKHPGKLKVTFLYVVHWRPVPLQAHLLAYENFKLFLLGRVTSFYPSPHLLVEFSASILSSEIYFTRCESRTRASVKHVCRLQHEGLADSVHWPGCCQRE